MKWLENITGGYSSSAKVVDGTLILSLPDATSPVVWRMDLGQVRASAMEVRTGDDGNFLLVLKTPKGDVNEIAPFEDKARALKALMAVSRAMEQAHGQTIKQEKQIANDDGTVTKTVTASAPEKKKHGGNVIASIFGILILLGLITVLVNMGSNSMADLAGSSPAAGSPSNSAAAAGSPGTPVSADDFLRKRQ